MNREIKNLFTDAEIAEIKQTVANAIDGCIEEIYENQVKPSRAPKTRFTYSNQGRRDFFDLTFSESIVKKITDVANSWDPENFSNLSLTEIQYTEYRGDIGKNPSLGIHFDFGKNTNFLIDYQLESNITWGIGIGETVYEAEDNSAVLLNQITSLHYRPRKIFQNNEYMQVLFFKFSSEGVTYTSPDVTQEEMSRIVDVYNNYYN